MQNQNQNQNQNQDQEALHDLYRGYVEDVTKSQLSNSESFDKAILTLSSAGLALSLSFIQLIVPLENAVSIGFLEAAWIFFLVAIICTVISFRISQIALDVALAHAEKYYLEGLGEYEDKHNAPASFTGFLNWIACLSFIVAVSLIIYFATKNV